MASRRDEPPSLRAAYEARGEQLVRERSALAEAVNTRISEVRSELTSLRSELASLRSELASLRSEVGALRSDLTSHGSALGSHASEQDALRQRVTELERAVVDITTLLAKPPIPKVLTSVVRLTRPLRQPLLHLGFVRRAHIKLRARWR